MARRIYTRGGDKGKTGLADGARVDKFHPRLEAYGTVDELNAFLGLALQSQKEISSQQAREEMHRWLEALHNDLFNIGADLAVPIEKRWQGMILVGEKEIGLMEKLIDRYQQQLPELKNFILPGGTKLSSLFHCCRTICRRAERAVTRLQQEEEINPYVLSYLNRLSDFLFIAARWAQHQAQLADVCWDKDKGMRTLEEWLTKEE